MNSTRNRLGPAIGLWLVVAALLTGCGGRSTAGSLQDVATGALDVVVQYMPQVNLPRITLDYDASGVPSVFGVRTSSIAQFVPLNLSMVELTPARVQWLMERNVQHVELDVNAAGLFVYVNGKALPYLAWNEDRLAYAGQLLDGLELVQNDSIIARAMPLLSRVGINVLARFPAQHGQTEIPLRERSARVLAGKPALTEPTAVIQGVIEYGDDGVPSVAGITSREITQLTRLDLHVVELPPRELTRLATAGVGQVAAVTAADGLHLLVNEKELVHVAYSDEHLMNAIELYAQLAGDERGQAIATFLANVVPILYGADIDVVAVFPDGVGSGQ